MEIDKLSPESWCVVGNSFSLRREHETAVKFFERALQLDRSFAYAHTLCGHEYVCNEDLEKAIQSFREAIYHDDRHYNAWYGLGKCLLCCWPMSLLIPNFPPSTCMSVGTIYFRQERFELSEYHFKRAIEINPNSSVLRCHLGLVLNAHNRSVLPSNLTNSADSIEQRRQWNRLTF
jgi:anaphase-promoting complex subunit 3